ncbi:MAG: MauE/DoxX family redox-associated membrane protein [Mycobacteriales bacterium]
MHLLTPAFLAAAGLLAVAGVAKLARPAGTSVALRAQGLPAWSWLVHILGAAELAVAAAALLELRFGAALLAATYGAFSVFVLTALVRGRPLTSCGCFAEPDVPPTPVHVVVTAALAACGGAVAAGSGGGLPDLLNGPVLPAVAAVGSAVLVGWLTYLVLAELPRLVALGSAP